MKISSLLKKSNFGKEVFLFNVEGWGDDKVVFGSSTSIAIVPKDHPEISKVLEFTGKLGATKSISSRFFEELMPRGWEDIEEAEKFPIHIRSRQGVPLVFLVSDGTPFVFNEKLLPGYDDDATYRITRPHFAVSSFDDGVISITAGLLKRDGFEEIKRELETIL